MKQCEQLVEGIGFLCDSFNQLTLDDCRSVIAETAYLKWLDAGSPANRELDFWLEAERTLFFGFDGGYFTYVCDLSQKCNRGHIRHWNEAKITPDGVTIL